MPRLAFIAFTSPITSRLIRFKRVTDRHPHAGNLARPRGRRL